MEKKYSDEVVPALMKKFGYKSIMQVPRLEKINLNRGVNGAVSDKKLVDVAVDELSTDQWSKGRDNNVKERYFEFQTS